MQRDHAAAGDVALGQLQGAAGQLHGGQLRAAAGQREAAQGDHTPGDERGHPVPGVDGDGAAAVLGDQFDVPADGQLFRVVAGLHEHGRAGTRVGERRRDRRVAPRFGLRHREDAVAHVLPSLAMLPT